MNELSELQSVDFAFGAFLAGAFAGYAPDKGPKGWQEFIRRPVKQQIMRHEADTPYEFMRDFLASQKDKKDVPDSPGATVNAPAFPIVYYFRKPGIVNTQDQRGSRGRVWNGDKMFRLRQLPVALDYTLVILAWDKLTLDKIQLAWYAHISGLDAFNAPYVIGGESFDMRVALVDNKNVAMQNASDTADGKRLYASTTPVSIMTNILVGHQMDAPDTARLIYGYGSEDDQQYMVAPVDGQYHFDPAERNGTAPVNPGTVRVMVGARIVGEDDGHSGIDATFEHNGLTVTLAGTVNYYTGVIDWEFSLPVADAVSVAYKPLAGRAETSYV